MHAGRPAAWAARAALCGSEPAALLLAAPAAAQVDKERARLGLPPSQPQLAAAGEGGDSRHKKKGAAGARREGKLSAAGSQPEGQGLGFSVLAELCASGLA